MNSSIEETNFSVHIFGESDADTLLIQMVDDHDMEVIEKEVAYIRELSGGQSFCLKAIKVASWNHDLSPWPAPPVFGEEGFGDGAEKTLQYLMEKILPDVKEIVPESSEEASPVSTKSAAPTRIFLGGYSLAGLFALWAGCQTNRFSGIAAASPSAWFPHFTEYIREHVIKADAVYLSLGDREERTKNPVMSQVGNAIREISSILTEQGKDCVLEWNKGNHFKNPDLRTAKAFAWLMMR